MIIDRSTISLLLKHSFKSSGASVRLRDKAVLGQDFKPDKGYMVGVRDIYITEDLNQSIQDLIENIYQASKALNLGAEDNVISREADKLIYQDYFIGSWLTRSRYYIDLSVYLEDKEDAIRLGLKHHQEAIYDIKNKEDIKI